MKILEVDNLCKNYGKGSTLVKALDDVSFSVEEGEFVVILGQSGAGKSTVLNMLGEMDVPTSGSVIVDNADISGMNDKQLSKYWADKIGFIFQSSQNNSSGGMPSRL